MVSIQLWNFWKLSRNNSAYDQSKTKANKKKDNGSAGFGRYCYLESSEDLTSATKI